MFSKMKTSESIKTYSDNIQKAADLIKNSDKILIGAGAGMSASGGISYADEVLFKKWFPRYYSMGMRSLVDMQSIFWNVDEKNARSYWGYWANHIKHIRYDSPALKPYIDLFKLVKDKNYFVITTNVDGQFGKAGFAKKKIFEPQGEYALFQCDKPCKKEVFDNKEMINKMISNMDTNIMKIREEDIPRCPYCKRLLKPNLRIDDSFVEEPHLVNLDSYENFIHSSKKDSLVLIELGVGFDTPVIIRYPFQNIVYNYPNSSLIRINLDYADVPCEIENRSVSIKADIKKALNDISNNL